MSEFEFVLILVSIILGLGMTDLLTVLARVLRQEFAGGLIHALWALHAGALLLQQFWSKWHASVVSDWSVYQLVFFIAPSLIAFLAAALVSPTTVEGGKLDQYFLARRRPFFGVLMLLMLSYSFERWFLDGLPITSADAVSLVFIAIYAFAAIREDRLTQVSTALAATALLAGFTLGWTETLSQLATG